MDILKKQITYTKIKFKCNKSFNSNKFIYLINQIIINKHLNIIIRQVINNNNNKFINNNNL